MNEFKIAFEALASVEANLRCGVSLTSDDEIWSLFLKRLCSDYLDAFEIYNNRKKVSK